MSTVKLVGGPMDGWVVPAGAPVLRPDWHETWPVPEPPHGLAGVLARLFRIRRTAWPWARPGRYVVDDDTATWGDL
jgi:hypothetical protein